MKLPREDSITVTEVLNSTSLSIHDKAVAIHEFDYKCSCQATNGHLPRLMSVAHIESEIKKRESLIC